MGTTFVSLSDDIEAHAAGFWMRDWVLELWLRLLALHIPDATTDPSSVNQQIRDQWLLASRGGFNGCVPHSLDEAVSSDEGESVVRKAIGSLMRVLKRSPGHLDAETLNLLGMDARFSSDIEARRLIDVGQAFLDLLDGKIETVVGSTDFMPGSK